MSASTRLLPQGRCSEVCPHPRSLSFPPLLSPQENWLSPKQLETPILRDRMKYTIPWQGTLASEGGKIDILPRRSTLLSGQDAKMQPWQYPQVSKPTTLLITTLYPLPGLRIVLNHMLPCLIILIVETGAGAAWHLSSTHLEALPPSTKMALWKKSHQIHLKSIVQVPPPLPDTHIHTQTSLFTT